MAVAGLACDGDGFGVPFGRFSSGFGGGVLDWDVVVVTEEAVVVVEVVESEAEETDMQDSGGSRAAGAGARCSVL